MEQEVILDRPLIISPEVAVKVGLEEATMLHIITSFIYYERTKQRSPNKSITLDREAVSTSMPFWNDHDIERISKSLCNQGLIELDSPPYIGSYLLIVRVKPQVMASSQSPKVPTVSFTDHQHSTEVAQADLVRDAQREVYKEALMENYVAPKMPEASKISVPGSGTTPVKTIDPGAMGIESVAKPAEVSVSAKGVSKDSANCTAEDEASSSSESPISAAEETFSIDESTSDHSPSEERSEELSTLVVDATSAVETMRPITAPSSEAGGQQMYAGWWPKGEVFKSIQQLDIPRSFAAAQVSDFVNYWIGEGATSPDWDREFNQAVLMNWRAHQENIQNEENAVPMTSNWQPDKATLAALVEQQIPVEFVIKAVPLFVAHWMSIGIQDHAWGEKFAEYVSQQWAFPTCDELIIKVDQESEQEEEVQLEVDDWTPLEASLQVVDQHNIPREYAEGLIEEYGVHRAVESISLEDADKCYVDYVKERWVVEQKLAIENLPFLLKNRVRSEKDSEVSVA